MFTVIRKTNIIDNYHREAARECRRKKKEYIKCLENRVAVLENRNQTLIDELKSLKELYQQKTDWGWYMLLRYQVNIKSLFSNESAHALTMYIVIDVIRQTKVMYMHSYR